MRKPYHLLLLWLLPTCLMAQVRYDVALARQDSAVRAAMPRVVLKWAPLALIEMQNTFELGAEVRLADRFSIQGQFGYAPDWLQTNRTGRAQYTQRETWRARLEPRWYLDLSHRPNYVSHRRGYFPAGQYVALDLLYKQMNTLDNRTIGRDCDDRLGCAYFQRVQERVVAYAGGVALKYGSQLVIGYDRRDLPRLLLDIYVGIGVRFTWTERPETQPGDLRFDTREWVLFDPFSAPTSLRGNVPIGVKLGYVLR